MAVSDTRKPDGIRTRRGAVVSEVRPEDLWVQHPLIGLALETVYVQFQLEQIEWLEFERLEDETGVQFEVSINGVGALRMSPGEIGPNGEQRWFVDPRLGKDSVDYRVSLLSAIFIEDDILPTKETRFMAMSTYALLLKARMWLKTK